MSKDYTRASHVEVEVEYALETSPGNFGTPDAMGCLVGTITENVNAEETEVDINTWCEIQARNTGAPGIRQTEAGEIDYTITGEIAVVVKSGSAWQDLRAAMFARDKVKLKITYSDSNSAPNTHVIEVIGFLSNFNTQSPDEGISTSPFTMRVLEIVA